MSTSSSRSNRSLPFKCSLALAVLLLLAELLAVSCVHNDADNQLVALEEEENNDLNDLNPGNHMTVLRRRRSISRVSRDLFLLSRYRFPQLIFILSLIAANYRLPISLIR